MMTLEGLVLVEVVTVTDCGLDETSTHAGEQLVASPGSCFRLLVSTLSIEF